MSKLKINKDEKYILACSHGPDSMALFKMLLDEKIFFVVAHCNYHLRSESNEEERELQVFCEKYGIKFYSKSYFYEKEYGNVEAWARKERYEFFDALAGEIGIHNILVAHNQDDMLETYLIQKKRGGFVSYYGLKESYLDENGNYILRPLLSFRKSELASFCEKTSTPFSIDKSNFNKSYLRNRIRAEIVVKMGEVERNRLIEEIKKENILLEETLKKYEQYTSKKEIPLDFLLNLSDHDFLIVMYAYLNKRQMKTGISEGSLLDFRIKCQKRGGTFTYKKDGLTLEYEYGFVTSFRKINDAYSFEIQGGKILGPSFFQLNSSSPLFDIVLKKSARIIKPISKKDSYTVEGHSKSVSRLFIDWKLPAVLRNVRPGIYDDNGKLIYTPRYRKDAIPRKESLLLFKIENLAY
jgi:tRNA(Ile)-lysidine synthase